MDTAQMLNYFKSSLSKRLGRLMSNKLCMDTSMYMLMIVAEMYEGLLYGEQTDVNNATPRIAAPAPKESEWEVEGILSMLTQVMA